MKLTSRDVMRSLLIAILNNAIKEFNKRTGSALDIVVVGIGDNYNNITTKCEHGHVMEVTVDDLFDCMSFDEAAN